MLTLRSGLPNGRFLPLFKETRPIQKVWSRLQANGRLFSTSMPKEPMLKPDRFQRQVRAKSEGSPTPPEQASPPLKVVRPVRKLMSYNTENFYKTVHGKMLKSPQQIQALAEVIEKEAPDVIALQEVGDKALLSEFNKKYLKGAYPNIVSHRAGQNGSIQVAMMSRNGIDITDSKSHWKDICADTQGVGKRDFLEATFKTNTGYRFTVFNAHLKSMRGDEAKTAPVRMVEAGAAAKILKKFLASNPKAHVLVTGDFNTLHQTPLGKPVIDTFMYLEQSPPSGKVKPVFSEVCLKDGKADPTQSTGGRYPDAKLDYTFASEALTPLIQDAYVAGQFAREPWSKASDHLPLVTVFEEGKPHSSSLKEHLPETRGRGKKRKLELIA